MSDAVPPPAVTAAKPNHMAMIAMALVFGAATLGGLFALIVALRS